MKWRPPRRPAAARTHVRRKGSASPPASARQTRNRPLVEAEEHAVAIVDDFSKAVVLLTARMHVARANHAFYRMFHTTPAETEGRLLWDLGDGQWNIAALRTLLEQIVPSKTELTEFAVTHVFPGIGRRHMLLDAHVTCWGAEHTPMILLGFEDITVRRQSEEERDATIALLRLLNQPGRLKAIVRPLLTFLREHSECGAVAIRLRNGEDFTYFETLGLSRDFVRDEDRLCATDANGVALRDAAGNAVLECLCGRVLTGRTDPARPCFTSVGSFWTNSTTRLVATPEADGLAPMRGRCINEGYESLALIPLHAGGETVGLLQFCDRRPDRFTAWSIALLEALAGNVAATVAHRSTAEALRRTEERLMLAAEAAQVAAWDYDPVRHRIDWSERCRKILGIPADAPGDDESFVGRLHPDDRARVSAQIWQALDPTGTSRYEAEYRVVDVDGTVRWIGARGRAYFEGEGSERRAVRMAGTVMDITAQKHAVERDRLLVAEKAANQAKDDFIAMLSHEVRNPLNAIQGWAALLQRGDLDPATSAKALDAVVRNARAQAQLINDLLDVSRIVRGKYEIEPVSLELRPVVQAALETVRPVADAKDIRFDVVLEDVGTILGDGVRIQQLVWNLLQNAIKFTPQGGRVDVRLTTSPGPPPAAPASENLLLNLQPRALAEITVSDTGIGIKAEFLPYIFDRFRQADGPVMKRYAGLGLGLTLVRHIAELHGGTVDARSAGEGHGATFTVRLPIQSASAAAAAAARTAEMPSLKGVRVLVVDDAADARDWVQTVLMLADGDVRAVGDAQEALALVSSWRPHVLISDIHLPNRDGYWLIRAVRTLAPQKGGKTAALALTAWARDEDRQQALVSGFHAHMAKPADAGQLVQTVAALAPLTYPHPV